jgi:hypothetical protein
MTDSLTDTLKCDRTLPGCLRCAKIKKQCPGYRIEQDLLFYNQDVDSIALKSARPRRKERVEVPMGPEESSDSSVSGIDKKFPILGHAFCGIIRAQSAGTEQNSVFQSAKVVKLMENSKLELS